MNKLTYYRNLLLALVLILLLAPGFYAQETGEGFVYEVSGEAQVLRGPWWNFWSWQKLESGYELLAGDRLKVGADSFVEVEFYNDSQLRVAENTLLIIGESEFLEYDLEQEYVRSSSVRVERGQIWVKVEKAISKMLKFKVETPNAVAGVRGTTFLVQVTDKKTDLLVDEGLVELIQSGRSQESVLVQGGFKSQVLKKEKPTPPEELTGEEREELQKWVKQVAQDIENRKAAKERVQKLKEEKLREKAEKEKAEDQEREKGHGREKKEEKNSERDHPGRGNGVSDNGDNEDDDDNGNGPPEDKGSGGK